MDICPLQDPFFGARLEPGAQDTAFDIDVASFMTDNEVSVLGSSFILLILWLPLPPPIEVAPTKPGLAPGDGAEQ